MTPELISFKLCPYVQSSVITLLHKKVDYKITYIDINDPPEWFDELSPTGQVPVLKLHDGTVLFESAVINEYLNDINGGDMMPDDPLQKALNRAWIQFCSTILMDTPELIGAADQKTMENVEYDIHEKLDRVEACKTETSCFNGDEINLIDTIFASLFMRLDLLKPMRDILDSERYPKLYAWSQHLLSLDTVKNSVVNEFPQIYLGMIKMRKGFISRDI